MAQDNSTSKKLAILSFSLFLSGCNFLTGNDNLEDYIARTKNEQQGDVEAIPAIPRSDTFRYTVSGYKDPTKENLEKIVANATKQVVGLDMTLRCPQRQRVTVVNDSGDQVEHEDLDFVGVYTDKANKNILLMQVKNGGTVYSLEAGNCIGSNFVKITNVGTQSKQTSAYYKYSGVTESIDGVLQENEELTVYLEGEY